MQRVIASFAPLQPIRSRRPCCIRWKVLLTPGAEGRRIDYASISFRPILLNCELLSLRIPISTAPTASTNPQQSSRCQHPNTHHTLKRNPPENSLSTISRQALLSVAR